MEFLPVTKQEMVDRGWEQCDFVYVCGDAYVDHPSFGHAIISRILESHGYNVGSRTGRTPSPLMCLAAPGWAFWSAAATWTAW